MADRSTEKALFVFYGNCQDLAWMALTDIPIFVQEYRKEGNIFQKDFDFVWIEYEM